MTNRIEPLLIPSVLAHEDLFPGRIVRAEPTQLDIESGFAGPIQILDISWGNFGRLWAAGVDLNASFTWDTNFGRFTPNFAGTWNDAFNTVVVDGVLSQDRVGITFAGGTIPRWRAIASTAWSRGPLNAFVAARFVSPYEDALIDGKMTGRTIPTSILCDVQASLEVGEILPSASTLKALELTVGIKNVLDEAPHFVERGVMTSGTTLLKVISDNGSGI